MTTYVNTLVGGVDNDPVIAVNEPIVHYAGLGSGGVWGNVHLTPAGHILISQAARQVISELNIYSGLMYTKWGTGVAGYSGDGGPADECTFANPGGVSYDSAGNAYMADVNNYVIRRIDAVTGVITTVAGNGTRGYSGDGGPATAAMFSKPRTVVVDKNGDLLITDTDNHRIRKVDMTTGIVTTVCGTGSSGTTGNGGPATAAKIAYPLDMVVDLVTNDYYFPSWDKHNIRKVDGTTGIISQVAGTNSSGFSGDGGAATAAKISWPTSLALNAAATRLYIADESNERIRVVDLVGGTIDTYAGTGSVGYTGDGGSRLLCTFDNPRALTIDANENLYITERGNHNVRKITYATGIITTVAGDGTAPGTGTEPLRFATISNPYGCAYSPDKSKLYIAENGARRIKVADLVTGQVTIFAGTGESGNTGDGGQAVDATFGSIYQITVGKVTGNVYIADLSYHRVRVVNVGTGVISAYAGTGSSGHSGDGGPALSAQMTQPISLESDASENIYIAAYGNKRVRKVDYATGNISTFAGNGSSGPSGDGGAATSAAINRPYQCSINPAGTYMYIATRHNHQIRRVDMSTGIITTTAGTGSSGYTGDGGLATAATLNSPRGVVGADDAVYISDVGNSVIRKVDLATGNISTYAGNGLAIPMGEGIDAL